MGTGFFFLPFRFGILLIPVVDMPELVPRIILETHGGHRRPLSMFLRDSFLCDTFHLQFLAFSQLADNGALALLVYPPCKSAPPSITNVRRRSTHQ